MPMNNSSCGRKFSSDAGDDVFEPASSFLNNNLMGSIDGSASLNALLYFPAAAGNLAPAQSAKPDAKGKKIVLCAEIL